MPRAAAEDLTSATFERVIRSWRSYDAERASERTWILAIARNVLRDHFRRQRHRSGVSLDEYPEIADALASGEEDLDRVLSDDALRAWLAPLSDREREVVTLRYAADLPAEEVARLTGLSAVNVHQIASRALRRLRRSASSDRLSGSA